MRRRFGRGAQVSESVELSIRPGGGRGTAWGGLFSSEFIWLMKENYWINRRDWIYFENIH
jgi:hypothetical protein